jgi:hypothetical protein
VNLHDVRVIEPREGARLARETLDPLGIKDTLGREDLQGHDPIDEGITSPVDPAHSPDPDEFVDLEFGKLSPYRLQRRVDGWLGIRDHALEHAPGAKSVGGLDR